MGLGWLRKHFVDHVSVEFDCFSLGGEKVGHTHTHTHTHRTEPKEPYWISLCVMLGWLFVIPWAQGNDLRLMKVFSPDKCFVFGRCWLFRAMIMLLWQTPQSFYRMTLLKICTEFDKPHDRWIEHRSLWSTHRHARTHTHTHTHTHVGELSVGL